MGKLVLSFRDLRVYDCAFIFQQEIFELSKKFPAEEKFSLTDQIRRSSCSIGANVAEAWQKRRYVAHFVSKLTDSDAENAETQHWLVTAMKCGYITPETFDTFEKKSKEIGSMLGKMINEPEKWCKE
ncbi:MAG TPA: four helix bundle protein [Chitinispirillaceae bacterium]|nr:four helix bundle protein [Chitinispirillaceae bacterium]